MKDQHHSRHVQPSPSGRFARRNNPRPAWLGLSGSSRRFPTKTEAGARAARLRTGVELPPARTSKSSFPNIVPGACNYGQSTFNKHQQQADKQARANAAAPRATPPRREFPHRFLRFSLLTEKDPDGRASPGSASGWIRSSFPHQESFPGPRENRRAWGDLLPSRQGPEGRSGGETPSHW